jgi:hypothetical protein
MRRIFASVAAGLVLVAGLAAKPFGPPGRSKPPRTTTTTSSVATTTTTRAVVTTTTVACVARLTMGMHGCGPEPTTPPDPAGYFDTAPQGSWSSLPTAATCANDIRHSTWEPRPTNAQENATMPDTAAVRASFQARPRSSSYNANWDSWLLPRVDGQFTGSTDEIIQWAACKWGIDDNVLRAQAVRESTWYSNARFSDGACYWNYGCGDAFNSEPLSARTTYCNHIATFGHDYQADDDTQQGDYPWTQPQAGMCPKTFSIIGIMAWDNPAWQAPDPAWQGNQNGTFPFSAQSTAFAMDYEAAYLRGCMEGWVSWLGSNDIWGCVGSWFSGDWHSPEADGYISRVQTELSNHTWLTSAFINHTLACDPAKGCPQ